MITKTSTTHCMECNAPLPAGRKRSMKFCAVATGDNKPNKQSQCKANWNNRQAKRGQLVLPLVMAMRFDRADFAETGAYKTMCRLISTWEAEDARAGRASCEPLSEVLPRLFDQGHVQRGDIVAYNAAGNKRRR